jgi:hypothetical protein
MLKNSLEAKGAALTEQQEQEVMNVLYGQRKGMKWDYDYADQHDANPAKFTSEALERYQVQAGEYDKAVNGPLAGVLNEQQMETYNQQREQLRKMEKMWLGMAQSMFGEK